MQPTPIAPGVPIAPAVQIPGPALSMPAPQVPLWEPVPIYRDAIPGLNPEPSPEPTEQAPEPSTPEPPTEKEVLDAVGEMITPTPVAPPWDPPVQQPVEPESTMETIEVPFTDLEVPVPPQEIMVTAVTTAGAAAVVSVGATMAAGKIFGEIVKIAKPIFKFVLKKLAKIRGKDPGPTWARARLLESRQRRQSKRVMRGGS